MSAGAVYVRVVVIDVYFNVDVAWRGVRSVGRRKTALGRIRTIRPVLAFAIPFSFVFSFALALPFSFVISFPFPFTFVVSFSIPLAFVVAFSFVFSFPVAFPLPLPLVVDPL